MHNRYAYIYLTLIGWMWETSEIVYNKTAYKIITRPVYVCSTKSKGSSYYYIYRHVIATMKWLYDTDPRRWIWSVLCAAENATSRSWRRPTILISKNWTTEKYYNFILLVFRIFHNYSEIDRLLRHWSIVIPPASTRWWSDVGSVSQTLSKC